MTLRYTTTAICLFLSTYTCLVNANNFSVSHPFKAPYELLNTISEASKTKAFEGRFVYLANNQLRSLEVLHSSKEGVELERLTPLNSEGPEILRRGDELICIHPEGDSMRVANSLPSGPFSSRFSQISEAINEIYELRFDGTDKVAGRLAKKYKISPKDPYRYAYSMWIDNESGLLLKYTLLGEQNQGLETFEFVVLKVGSDISESSFEHQFNTESKNLNVVHLDGKISSQRNIGWKAAWVPPGFTMAGCDIRRLQASNIEVNAMVYSDGMSSFTVFIEKLGSENETSTMPNNQFGATASFSTELNTESGNYLITVMGELPMKAVEKIAKSVARL